MTGHDAIDVAEAADRIAVAIDHFDELAVIVIAILHQGFNSLVVNDAFNIGQAAQGVVVMQVHPHTASGADVGELAFNGVGEMQEMAQAVFDALQRHRGVVVRHLAEVEEDVIEGLQQVVTAFGADQIRTLLKYIFT